MKAARLIETLEEQDRRWAAQEIYDMYGREYRAANGAGSQTPPDDDKDRDDKWVIARKNELYKNAELRTQVHARDGGRCRYCGIEVNWSDRRGPTGATYDHVDPDEGNTLENVVVACRSCNVRKGYHIPEGVGMRLLPPGSTTASAAGVNSGGESEVDPGQNGGGSPPAPPFLTILERREERRKPHKEQYRAQAIEVLEFLNLKASRSYRPVPENLKLIQARLRSGASVQDCKSVIARKVRAWKLDPALSVYLRPATLFNATKFEQYLGEREPDDA